MRRSPPAAALLQCCRPRRPTAAHSSPASNSTPCACCPLLLPQIRDLNRGAFGFVVLALDKTTGEQVALKFIERGPEVGSRGERNCLRWSFLRL